MQKKLEYNSDKVSRDVLPNFTLISRTNLKLMMMKELLMKLPNWKAPGSNGVQGFWIVELTGLHTKMAQYLNLCLL